MKSVRSKEVTTMQGLTIFPTLAMAIDAGYQVYDRTPKGYLMRTRTSAVGRSHSSSPKYRTIMASIIIDSANPERAVPTIPTRVALPRQSQSDLFGGWGVRFSK
jgi:hypothetical protein